MLIRSRFIMGSNKQLSPISRLATAAYGATVVNTSYRLAPVHKFPTAANDTWDTLKWLAANHESIGADPSAGFIIYGISAGGNLAAAVAQKWHDEQCLPKLTGISLGVPLLLDEQLVPEKYKHLWFSREQNADSMLLNNQALAHMMQSYEPDISSPDWSPFNSETPHTGLPPVYISVNGQDPLRDDGLIYEKVLRDHGVKTKLAVFPGVPHGHEAFPGLGSAVKSFFETVRSFGWLLGNEKTVEELKEWCRVESPSGFRAWTTCMDSITG